MSVVLQEVAVPPSAVNVKSPTSLVKGLPRAVINKTMLGARVAIGLIGLFIGIFLVFLIIDVVVPGDLPLIGKPIEKAKNFLGL